MAEDMDIEMMTESEAAVASRSVRLTTGPTGVTYFLEPKYGHIRGIVCRRADGVRVKCPDSLEGGFTDGRNALAAVQAYIRGRGKAKQPGVNVPVREFHLPEPVNLRSVEVIEASEDAKQEAAAILAEIEAEQALQMPEQSFADEEEFEVEEEPAPEVINLSEGKPDPEGETITQKARNKRLPKQ